MDNVTSGESTQNNMPDESGRERSLHLPEHSSNDIPEGLISNLNEGMADDLANDEIVPTLINPFASAKRTIADAILGANGAAHTSFIKMKGVNDALGLSSAVSKTLNNNNLLFASAAEEILGGSSHITGLEAMAGMLNKQRAITNSIIGLTTQSLIRNNDLIAIATAPQLYSKSVAAWNLKWSNSAALISHSFTIPAAIQVPGLLGIAEVICGYKGATEKLTRLSGIMTGLNKPWLDVDRPQQSIAGISSLLDLGNKLNTHIAFGKTIPNLLRERFGDWRKEGVLPKEFDKSKATRQKFYDKVGFDPTITAFPSESYQEVLVATGVGRPVDYSIEDFPEPIADYPDIEDGISMSVNAYRRLAIFEAWLRKFIDDKMIAKHGGNWYKHRLPPDTYKSWSDKKQKREEASGGAYQGSLIDFADFTDYQRIITRRDDWRDVFQRHFRTRLEDVTESFNRLGPIRVDVAHSRKIDKRAFILLLVETDRIWSC